MRPKVKFLTVVWGETYIARFAMLSLPSFLADGNLPALAEATDLEVVIMTRRDDIDFFENHATFHRLRAICPVRFVEIDDLVAASVYGVTLTLAYARPIIACGREMLNIHFVFMNADFVLGNGSLQSLSQHIVAGRSIVLAPSFRATAETVEPILEASVDAASNTLAVSPRQLAKLSLEYPHPTTVAKTLNQDFCHSKQPNQFFWQVDEQTMLGRYYLIFMLCLKPERLITTINSYCDYAFIPEMCPSGDEVVMNDSDDFFMLELQERNQELFLLQLGGAPDEVIASSLQYWTTAEHRRAARYDIVLHAAEVPPAIEKTKAEASAFIDRIDRKLRRPLPHARHKFWIHGVEAWKYHRRNRGLSSSPPELATEQGGFREWFSPGYLRSRMLKLYLRYHYASHFILPQRISKLPIHPYWLDYRLLRETILNICTNQNAYVLVVRDEQGFVDRFFDANAQTRFAAVQDVLEDGAPAPKPGSTGYTHTLIYLRRKDCRSVQDLVKKCQSVMGPNGTYHVIIHYWLGEIERGNFSYELVTYFEDIIGWPPQATACSFVGGALKRFNAKILLRLSRHYAQFGRWSLLWILPPLAVGLILTLIGNLCLKFKLPSRNYVDYCSSAAIRFTAGQAASSLRTRDGGNNSVR